MANRPHHQRIMTALHAFNPDALIKCSCYFAACQRMHIDAAWQARIGLAIGIHAKHQDVERD
jgi:hypothetical protein